MLSYGNKLKLKLEYCHRWEFKRSVEYDNLVLLLNLKINHLFEVIRRMKVSFMLLLKYYQPIPYSRKE